MEEIIHKIDVSICASFIINNALQHIKGPKTTTHSLIIPTGRISLQEINITFKSLFGPSFQDFISIEEAITRGVSQIRIIDSFLIGTIASLDKEQLNILLGYLEEKKEKYEVLLEMAHAKKSEAIQNLENSAYEGNKKLFQKRIIEIRKASHNLAFVDFSYQRYQHFIEYIRGLTYEHKKVKYLNNQQKNDKSVLK